MTRFFVLKKPFPLALLPLTSYLVFFVFLPLLFASRIVSFTYHVLSIAGRLLSSPSTHLRIFPFRIVALALLFLLPLASILLPITTAHSAQVTLAWNPNSESDLAGYKIYYGTEDNHFCVDVGNQTSYTVSNLEKGKTYVFAATAYDNYGNESGFSNKVYFSVSRSDTDGDGIPDYTEVTIYGTDPYKADTDGDGITDGDELAFWSENWNCDDDGDGIVNLMDPDSDGDGVSDGVEIGYGLDPSNHHSKFRFPPLEIGEVTIDHNWTRVTFNKSFVDPVVVAKPLSYNGSDPAVVRVRNVDMTGFDIRIQEWEYLDGQHTSETVSYIVMERSSYTLENGTRVEAGRFETDKTGSFAKVMFRQSFQKVPIVITAVCSVNETDAVTTRVRKISTTSFQCCMQEQELNPKSHATETISYIAWEPSSGTLEGLIFEVNTTRRVVRDDFYQIAFDQSFTDIPFFLADMQTAKGLDTANLRWENRDPYGVYVKIDEEQSRDGEKRHTNEVVGYIAIESYY